MLLGIDQEESLFNLDRDIANTFSWEESRMDQICRKSWSGGPEKSCSVRWIYRGQKNPSSNFKNQIPNLTKLVFLKDNIESVKTAFGKGDGGAFFNDHTQPRQETIGQKARHVIAVGGDQQA